MEQDTEFASRPERRIDPELRQRLIKRIALAGLAIAVLLGGLAVIDRYYVPPPAKPPRTLSAALTPPVAKPAQAPPAAPAPEAQPELQAEAPPPPAPPAVPEQTASPSITRPASPAAAGHLRRAPQSAAENDRAPEKHVLPVQPRPTEKAAPRQYVFQMGVFNDVANAQQLNDKLKAGGVPSRIEARVQVGPFKTREEAEAARQKLIELGIQPGILMPVRK